MVKKILLTCFVNDQNQISLLTHLHLIELQQNLSTEPNGPHMLYHFTNSLASALENFKSSDADVLICVSGSLGLPVQFVRRSLQGPAFILGSFALPVVDFEQALGCVKASTDIRSSKYNVDLSASAKQTFFPGYMTLTNKNWGPLMLFKIDRSVLEHCKNDSLDTYDGVVVIDTSVTASSFGEVAYVGCVGHRERLRG